MDFKALVSKIASFETPAKKAAPITEAAAPKIQLSEDAEIRVLAGVSTILAEAKKAKPDFLDMDKDGNKKEPMKKAVADKKSSAVKEEMKVGDSKKTAKGGTVTKTKTGIVHKAGPGNYGGSDDNKPEVDDDDKPETTKKKVKEAANAKQQAAIAIAKKKKDKKMEEGSKPDFLDVDKDGDKKEPMKSAAKSKGSEKKADGKKGMSAKQAKFFGKKKAVKENNDRLTFKRCLEIVSESKGTMQIDPVDQNLWQWANRVGKSKFTESAKAQAFAAATYEKMGGQWDLHKTLTE